MDIYFLNSERRQNVIDFFNEKYIINLDGFQPLDIANYIFSPYFIDEYIEKYNPLIGQSFTILIKYANT